MLCQGGSSLVMLEQKVMTAFSSCLFLGAASIACCYGQHYVCLFYGNFPFSGLIFLARCLHCHCTTESGGILADKYLYENSFPVKLCCFFPNKVAGISGTIPDISKLFS